MDFSTFKTLYGHNEHGPKNVKFGSDFVSVDNKNYTITNINNDNRDEARRRLLGNTIASQQKLLGKNNKSSFLPDMRQLRSTTGTALGNIKETNEQI